MAHVGLLRLLASHVGDFGRYPRFLWRLWRRPDRVRLRGVTFELDASTSPTLRRLLYSERYERSESRCAAVALAPDDVVLEVGAGLGYLSTICALRLGSERVHTYEADPALIPRIRRHTDLPICIGFGIRTPEAAAEAASLADGAVVGTALVDTLAASLDEQGRAKPDTVRKVLDQVRGLAEAIRAKKAA